MNRLVGLLEKIGSSPRASGTSVILTSLSRFSPNVLQRSQHHAEMPKAPFPNLNAKLFSRLPVPLMCLLVPPEAYARSSNEAIFEG